MKILFITLLPINSNSSAMIRNNALIHGLLELNYQIDLVTLPPHKLNKSSLNWNPNINIKYINNYKEEHQVSSLRLTQKGNKKIFKKTAISFSKFIYQKFSVYDSSYISYLKSKPLKEVIKGDEYDFIISSSDPKTSHLFAQKVVDSGLKYKKWIQYWGDPLSQDITNKTVYPKKVLKLIEKKIFACSDKIIYVSPFTLKEQKVIFKNHASKMSYQPVPYIHEIISDFKSSEIENIGYFGDYFSFVRDIYPLYNAISLQEKFNMEIIGRSDVLLENRKNIMVSDRLPYKDVKKKEQTKDLLVCILNNFGKQLPGKLFHYAATDKPILVLYPKDIDEEILIYLEGFERYILCENTEEKINELFSGDCMQKDFKPVRQLSSKYIAEKFLEF